VLSRRGAVPGDFGEGGSTINVSGKRLRLCYSSTGMGIRYNMYQIRGYAFRQKKIH
jgi:hypothetical protein